MPVYRYFIFYLVFMVSSVVVRGQDIHFSQFNQAPLLLNPAFTGDFGGKIRLGANYRDQWKEFNAPYKTFSAYADGRINITRIKDEGCKTVRDYIGLGGYVYSDKAGDAGLSTTSAMLSLSYRKKLSRSFYASLGIALGFGQRKIDFTKLTLLSQWNGSVFTNDIPADLDRVDDSFQYLDFNGGIVLTDSITENLVLSLGTSLSHINKPENSFLVNESFIPWKYNFHGELTWLADTWGYTASGLVSNQDDFNQVMVSFLAEYFYSDRDIKYREPKSILNNKRVEPPPLTLLGGIGIRTSPVRDVFPMIGLSVRDIQFILSYDINFIDKYARYQNQGGFEVSLIARF